MDCQTQLFGEHRNKTQSVIKYGQRFVSNTLFPYFLLSKKIHIKVFPSSHLPIYISENGTTGY
jgi:hypothetical protein